jgi:DDE superfamily endonuclease
VAWSDLRKIVFLSKKTRSVPKVAMDTVPQDAGRVEPGREESPEILCRFRREAYRCLETRADELFELTDALLCAGGPVRSLAELSLEPEHRRGHGGLYDGLNAGRIGFARVRRMVAGQALPRVGGRIVLGVDITPWLRPDAETSPDRLFCHVHGRAKGTSQTIPGWPYSIVAALESGRTSWTRVWTRSDWARPTTSPR